PQVQVLRIVTAEEQIQVAVAVVVEPDGGVEVGPRGQAGAFGDGGEALPLVVVEKLRAAPFVEEKVLEAVVVVVAPHRAHRYARAFAVHVGEADGGGYVLEGAVAEVTVQRVLRADAAVGDVNVLPPVAVEVYHRHRRAHRRHLRHDVVELGVELRRFVRKLDARLFRHFFEIEAVALDSFGGGKRFRLGGLVAQDEGHGQQTYQQNPEKDACDTRGEHGNGWR